MNEHTTHQEKDNVIEMVINDFEVSPIVHEGYYPISLKTSRGTLECRYYASAERRRGVVFAGDAVGGWDSPVRNLLYPGLCKDLSRHNINCLRIQYRFPHNLAESILDVLAGITFLAQDGVETLGLVGQGFGAATTIQAATASPLVSTVISLSPQPLYQDVLKEFRDTQSHLFINSSNDKNFGPEIYYAVKDWLYKKV